MKCRRQQQKCVHRAVGGQSEVMTLVCIGCGCVDVNKHMDPTPLPSFIHTPPTHCLHADKHQWNSKRKTMETKLFTVTKRPVHTALRNPTTHDAEKRNTHQLCTLKVVAT